MTRSGLLLSETLAATGRTAQFCHICQSFLTSSAIRNLFATQGLPSLVAVRMSLRTDFVRRSPESGPDVSCVSR